MSEIPLPRTENRSLAIRVSERRLGGLARKCQCRNRPQRHQPGSPALRGREGPWDWREERTSDHSHGGHCAASGPPASPALHTLRDGKRAEGKPRFMSPGVKNENDRNTGHNWHENGSECKSGNLRGKGAPSGTRKADDGAASQESRTEPVNQGAKVGPTAIRPFGRQLVFCGGLSRAAHEVRQQAEALPTRCHQLLSRT